MDSDIHNWYEAEVFEKLRTLAQENSSLSDEQISDVACIALNHLPPRYVRHSVDMSFYTSPQEKRAMDERVDVSITNALEYVNQHPVDKDG